MQTNESARHPFGLSTGDQVLVVAPHPDDETIGPGGTIARLAAAGIGVHVLCVTVRAAKMWGSHSDPNTRLAEFETACKALGVTTRTIAWVDETGELDITTKQRDLVNLIEKHEECSLSAVRPEALVIPAAGGYHQDHQAVFRAAFAAARIQGPGLKPTPKMVLGYRGVEDRWSADSEPWWVHVDTSAHWADKEEALRAYGTQMRPGNQPRSLKHVRTIDAATGGSHCWEYGESFVPYRMSW